MNHLQVKQIEINGVSYGYIEQGAGPLILCIHGFPDNAYSFTGQLDALSRLGYRVVAPFLRGYSPTGASPDGKYHVAQVAADMVALIKGLGYEKAILIGHDYGAAVAHSAALLAPETIVALVTESVPHGPEMAMGIVTNPEQQKRSWYIYFFQLPFAEMAVSFNDYAFIDRLWSDWSPGWSLPREHVVSVKRTLAEPGVLSAALGFYRTALGAPPEDAVLAELAQRAAGAPIAVPCLYVHGQNDGCVGADLTQDMHKYFTKNFSRLVVEGAGHFVHLEKPDVFNRAVIDFLKDLTAGSGR